MRSGTSIPILSIALAIVAATTQTLGGSSARARSHIALQTFVEGAGSPLVMLGGGTFGAGAFAPHAHVLARDFRVVRIQTLNIERSQKQRPLPAGYSVKLESAAMTRALDGLGMSAPVDVVGWSFGALVALDFALDHPDRVRTLALFEPPAFWVVSPGELQADPGMRTMYELSKGFGPEREPTDDQYVRFLCALGNCGAKPPSSGEPERQDWVARRSALRGLAAVANHSDRRERLKTFRRPVLIMTGTETVAFHRRINDILAGDFPMAERVELTGGHSAPVTAREEFVAKLRAFLARHRTGT
jgi:pimeloyl-ACP methyl ester carboxylesterase